MGDGTHPRPDAVVRALLAVLLVAFAPLLLPGTAGAASPKDEREAATPADQARARAVVLRRADFPSGWAGSKRERGSSSREAVRCPGLYDPDFSGVTITGTAVSEDFAKQSATRVYFAQSVSEVYATRAQFALEWRESATLRAARCFARYAAASLREQVPGARAELGTVTSLALPRSAPSQDGWRVPMQLVRADGARLPVFMDVIALGHGRCLAAALVMSGPQPADAALERHLAQVTGIRLATACGAGR